MIIFVLALAAARETTHQRPATATRFDLAGTALLSLAVFGLIIGVSRAQVDGWVAVAPVVTLVATAALLVSFGLWERVAADPLLPRVMFRSPRLIVALAVILAAGLAHFGTAFYYALYLQQIRGFGPLQAGAGLLPLIGLVALGAPASGLLNRRYGPRLPIVAGLGLLCAGLTALSVFGVDSSLPVVLACTLPMGLGIGLAQPAAVEVAISAVPLEAAGRVAGVQQTVLMISGSLGVAIFGSIIAASAPRFVGHAIAGDQRGEYLTGFGHATTLGAILTFVAAGAAVIMLRSAPTTED